MNNNQDNIRESTKEFYNSVAKKFSDTRRYWWQELNFITKYLKGKENVLDFGCGNGRLLELILTEKKEKINYTGVDVSDELIKLAQQKHPDYAFKTIEKENQLDFKDQKFDLVFSIAVFHHFNSQMASDCLSELNRVLKKDGMIVITSWYLWKWQYFKYLLKSVFQGKLNLSADLPFKDNQGNLFWRYCYWWNKDRLIKQVQKAGFEIVEEGYTKDKNGKKKNIYLVGKKI